jgi:hypothetical protein
MSPPRFRLRTLLVAVAVAAVVLGAVMMARRAGDRRARAIRHAKAEAEARRHLDAYRGGRVELPRCLTLEEVEALTSRIEESVVFHAGMARKYERAAARPWLTVEPDPPEP